MSNIDAIMQQINKKYKRNIIVKGTQAKERKFIPFSSPMANYMTRGGVAVGKMAEFSGGEGGGKTTSATDIIANFQRLYPDRLTLYLDAENTYDDEWARKLGVDLERVIMIKPEEEHGEMLLDMVLDAIRSGDIGLFVLDSIPFLMSKQEFEGNLDDKTYAGNSQLFTAFCRKVIPLMNKFETTVIMINQIRDKMGVPYTAYNFPGGRMLKHSFSQRIFFRKGALLDELYREQSSSFENPTGHIVEMRFLKNKVTKNDRMSGYYTLHYEKGIDVVHDTVELAVMIGVVEQSGAWFRWNGLNIQGKANFTGKMREDAELFEELKREVYEAIV